MVERQTVCPDQMLQNVASDVGLHCLLRSVRILEINTVIQTSFLPYVMML